MWLCVNCSLYFKVKNSKENFHSHLPCRTKYCEYAIMSEYGISFKPNIKENADFCISFCCLTNGTSHAIYSLLMINEFLKPLYFLNSSKECSTSLTNTPSLQCHFHSEFLNRNEIPLLLSGQIGVWFANLLPKMRTRSEASFKFKLKFPWTSHLRISNHFRGSF
eukprot:NODE_331_length_9425_cov_0.815355.p4 type:complete len:164 gc:universal NODE_331_length_9425_cov_0.815355:8276-8767(+)